MPRITYNAIPIDLRIGPNGLDTEYFQERAQQRGGTGIVETINHYGARLITLDTHFDQAAYRQLVGWWSWARQGRHFALALDPDRTGSTTLSGPAAAAQRVIPLTATSAFAVGDEAFIRDTAVDDAFAAVRIAAVTAGVSVTVEADLPCAYVRGAAFRHLDYFPDVVSLDDRFNPRKAGDFYSHQFKMIAQ